MEDKRPMIYILMNPTFPQLVKIGYTKNLPKRMHEFNVQANMPEDFHCYAIYYCHDGMTDLKVHNIIDSLDSSLRLNRKREFYKISPRRAYDILKKISSLYDEQENIVLNPLKDDFINEYIKNGEDAWDASKDDFTDDAIKNVIDRQNNKNKEAKKRVPRSSANADSIQKVMFALSEPQRRKILDALKKGRLSVGEIVSCCGISIGSISAHMNILKNANLVRGEREGSFIVYELNTSILEDVLCWILSIKGDADE